MLAKRFTPASKLQRYTLLRDGTNSPKARRPLYFPSLTGNLKQVNLEATVMTDIVNQKLYEWVRGKSTKDARIAIYYKIRDIPYATIPELRNPERYLDILKLNAGSCMPKHLLLCNMYQRIGLEVLYVVYPFRWSEFGLLYPPELRKLADYMPIGNHLACKVDIGGKLTLVDATLDPALEELGLPVNKEWDGTSDTLLAVKPCGEEEIYHPSESDIMQPRPIDDKALAFYNKLTFWLEKVREQSEKRI